MQHDQNDRSKYYEGELHQFNRFIKLYAIFQQQYTNALSMKKS